MNSASLKSDLVISLVNHSNPDLLADCLDSIYKNTRFVSFQVWVVDNATDGKEVEEIRMRFPQTHWIFNPRRLGFSANHNQVLERARGRYYCILNDDTIIHERALDELVVFLDAHPQIGLAGPRLLNSDGTGQASAFRFPCAWFQIIEHCWLPPPLVCMKAWGVHPAQYHGEPQPVDWLLGACLVIRNNTLAQVGALDDVLSPVGNMEDTDWCRRVWSNAFEVWFVPASCVTHYGGQSYRKDCERADATRIEMARTTLRYFKKHHGCLAAKCVAMIYLIVLPWNIFVLLQMQIRRRLQSGVALQHIRTSLSIANVGLHYLVDRV